jgi:iron(III) transport system ATP-binding protein
MSGLRVENLIKRFGAAHAIDDVSFTVGPGEFVSLLGPSGCGKTTTLRCIAGFERPDSGRITVDGEVITEPGRGIFVPPNRRRFGMVFQSYAVWPHMTVMENVAYPLKVAGRFKRAEIEDRVRDKLRVVGLAGYEERYPTQLSGGQQQRVALARALVMEPRVLLFDEPLSNLDAKLRERMRFELIDIQSGLGIPAVYVTHDQSEAMVMSRRVIVMERGAIAQEGAPEDIYGSPRSRFVADFIGSSNFIEAKVVQDEGDGRCTVEAPWGLMLCVSAESYSPGTAVVAVRPERIDVGASALPGANTIPGVLKSRFFLGPFLEYFIDVNGLPLRVQRTSAIPAEPGAAVLLSIEPSYCQIVGRAEPTATAD